MRPSRNSKSKGTYICNGVEVVNQGTFSLLDSAGLLACSVKNDGNCLFRALSDQLTGNEHEHLEIRRKVVRFMAKNPAEFEAFITIGGLADQVDRPSRSCKKFKETDVEAMIFPTSDDHSAAFKNHLRRMWEEGTWGDQIEITAFAKCYNLDVKVFWANMGNMEPVFTQADSTGAFRRPCVYIGFNEAAEHYYSVRNKDGPFGGAPQVIEKSPAGSISSSEQSSDSETVMSRKSSKRTSPEDSEEDDDPIRGPIKRQCGMRRELDKGMEQQKAQLINALATQKMIEEEAREAQRLQAEADLELENLRVEDFLERQSLEYETERFQREAEAEGWNMVPQQPQFDSDSVYKID